MPRRRLPGLAALTIEPASHVDHGLDKRQLDYLVHRYRNCNAFMLETVTLPKRLGKVASCLYGPVAGDRPVKESEVYYGKRQDRKYDSRLIPKGARPTRQVGVIAGPHEGKSCVLYTAFGGPISPREVNDPTLPADQRQASVDFWKEHALGTGQGCFANSEE